MKHYNNAIAYIRVSTRKQGRSGLGQEAQVSAIKSFCKANELELIDTYSDIESGKNSDRSGLNVSQRCRSGMRFPVRTPDRDECVQSVRTDLPN